MQSLHGLAAERHAPAAPGPAHGQDRRPGAAAGDERARRRTSNTSTRCATCATSTRSAATRRSTSTGAMQLMDQMQDIDELERQLERTQYGGDIDDIDAEKLRDLLGDEARETLEQLKKFLEILEEAGYIRDEGQRLRADAARHPQDRPEGARRDLPAAQEGQARQARGPRVRAAAATAPTTRRSTSSATRSTCTSRRR